MCWPFYMCALRPPLGRHLLQHLFCRCRCEVRAAHGYIPFAPHSAPGRWMARGPRETSVRALYAVRAAAHPWLLARARARAQRAPPPLSLARSDVSSDPPVRPRKLHACMALARAHGPSHACALLGLVSAGVGRRRRPQHPSVRKGSCACVRSRFPLGIGPIWRCSCAALVPLTDCSGAALAPLVRLRAVAPLSSTARTLVRAPLGRRLGVARAPFRRRARALKRCATSWR